MPDPIEPSESKRRKCYALAKELGLTTQERHDLAQVLLRRDITSWGQLNERQYERVLDALEGFTLVQALFLQRH